MATSMGEKMIGLPYDGNVTLIKQRIEEMQENYLSNREATK